MSNTDKLIKEMKDWLQMPPDTSLTVAECFRIANNHDKWRVDMFYNTFAPYMANILDDSDRAERDFKGLLNFLVMAAPYACVEGSAEEQGFTEELLRRFGFDE